MSSFKSSIFGTSHHGPFSFGGISNNTQRNIRRPRNQIRRPWHLIVKPLGFSMIYYLSNENDLSFGN